MKRYEENSVSPGKPKGSAVKTLCVILMVLFTLVMAADIINLCITPAGNQRRFTPGGTGWEKGDFTLLEEGNIQRPNRGEREEAEGNTQNPRAGQAGGEAYNGEGFPGDAGNLRQTAFRQRVRNAWLPILILCVLGDGVCLLLYLRLRGKQQETREAPENLSGMEPLEEDWEEPPKRKHSSWIVIVCLGVAFAMILSMMPTASETASSATVQEKVLSDTPRAAQIQTVLSGAGTLEANSLTPVTVPQQVTVLKYHVRNGETVSPGDPLVSVDKTSAASAMMELQTVMKELDTDLEAERQKEKSAYVSASASGRVKKIYASVGDTVSQVLYENGALMLLSLDGAMKVEFSTQEALTLGEAVTVSWSGGSETGKIASVREGKVTVTLSDETAPYGAEATVTGEDGQKLGEGTLAINSELKVIGYYGTVKSLPVSVGSKVSAGSTLLTLENTGHTTDYQLLLARRQELEGQMEKLSQLAQTGMVTAEKDGIVSGVPDNAEIELLSNESGSGKGNTLAASSGGYRLILLSNVTEGGSAETETFENAEDASTVAPEDEAGGFSLLEDSGESTGDDAGESMGMYTDNDTTENSTVEDNSTEDTSTSEIPQVLYYAACILWVDGDNVSLEYAASESLTADSDPAQYQGQMTSTGTFTLSLTNPKAGDYLLLAVTGDSVSVIKHIPVTPTEPEPTPVLRNGTYAASWVSASQESLYLWLTADPVTDAAVDLTSLQAQMTQFGECAYSGISGADIPLTENGESKIVKLNELKQNDLLLVTFTDGIVTAIVKAQRVSSSTPGQSGGMAGGNMPSGGMSGMNGGGMSGGGGGGSVPRTPAYEKYSVAQRELLYVSDQQEVALTISVDELDILSLQDGLDAQVTLDAMKGQSFQGTVRKIGSEGTNDGGNTKFAVTVTLPREAAMLDGMNASVKIVTAASEAAVAIPSAALVEEDGKTYVYTTYEEKEDTLGGLTEVETGASDGELVEITGGIGIGDTFYYRYADTITYSFLTARA